VAHSATKIGSVAAISFSSARQKSAAKTGRPTAMLVSSGLTDAKGVEDLLNQGRTSTADDTRW